jgi:uncharacterized protein YybS (DUF2232 family)
VPQYAERGILKAVFSGIAITSLIFAVSISIPVYGFLISFLIPLPILFYRSKLGRFPGLTILFIMAIIVAVTLGRVSVDLLFFAELLILGFVLGELIERNLTIERTLVYACAALISAGIVSLFFYGIAADKKIISLASDYVARNLGLMIAMYENMGVPEEYIYAISSSLEHIKYFLLRIIPSLFVAFTLFIAWVNLLLAGSILKAQNLFYPDFGSLRLWKAPEFLVWAAIGCGSMLLLPEKALKVFGLNGLIILMTIYFFDGIAIISFFFEKKRFPRALRFFLYGLIAIQQVFLLLVIGLGFFDLWMNFRKSELKNSH